MRVAILTPDYPPDVIGGAGISCSLLARGLRDAGVEVDVFAFVASGADAERPRAVAGGADQYFPRPKSVVSLNLSAARQLRRRAADYDVVHVYDCALMPAGRLLMRRTSTPVVATLNNLRAACFAPELALREDCYEHGWLKSLRCVFANPEPSSRLRGLCYVHPAFHLANRLSRRLSWYIALTEDVKRHYVGAGFPEGRITVVPNMLDERVFSPAAVSENAHAADGERRILYVGQLDHRKGVLDLIEAFASIPAAAREGTRLVFLGRGKEEPAMRAAARRHGLEGAIEMRHCAYEQLPDEYRRAHVFVSPVRWPEPFGRTRLEALAIGAPILSSDTPSAREILGENAVYHRPFDVTDLAEKLQRLLEDAWLRRQVLTGADERLEAYRPERVVSQVMDVYDRALGGRPW